MKNWEDKWMDYIDGNLSNEDKVLFEQETSNDPRKVNSLKELQELNQLLSELHPIVPPQKLQSNFESYLETVIEDVKEPKVFKLSRAYIRNISAAVILLLSGLYVGQWLQSEPTPIKAMSADYTLVNTLLDESSPIKRIKGINASHTAENPDWDVVKLLLNTLEKDISSNVRMAAVQGLRKYLNKEDTRIGLIKALDKETDASVKIAIINLLTGAKEQRAIEPLQKIIGGENDLKFVKDEAQISLMHINSI